MICWSCEKNAGLSPHCGACGAVLPPEAQVDHFAVLGIGRRYDLDVAEVERRYKELARALHPDRYAKGEPRARRASLQRSVQLNDAWKTLRDPVRRAEYLLALSGFEVGGEEGTQRRLADGTKERLPVPQGLLMEIMDLREGLLEARMEQDDAAVARLTGDVRVLRARKLDEVAAGFARGAGDLNAIAAALVAVRYYDRFLDEVAAYEEARLVGGGEHAHG